MIRFWRQAAVIATSLLAMLTGFASAQTPTSPAPAMANVAHAGGRKRAASKPSPAPQPQPPPVPLTPEQMPPVPPQVTYRNGLLTIVATNSTLADILQAVSARTGASVDAPAHLTGERVAARLGPGTPRDVLSDLLRGPRFDYILVGSDGDPNAVRNIILTPNQSSPSASAAIAQAQPRSAQPAQEDMEEEVEEEQPVQPEPQPPQPAQQPPKHRPFAQPQPPDQIVGSPAAPQQPQVKTPEQLLEELRNLQQQNPPQR
jgi:hypothetical protein